MNLVLFDIFLIQQLNRNKVNKKRPILLCIDLKHERIQCCFLLYFKSLVESVYTNTPIISKAPAATKKALLCEAVKKYTAKIATPTSIKMGPRVVNKLFIEILLFSI